MSENAIDKGLVNFGYRRPNLHRQAVALVSTEELRIRPTGPHTDWRAGIEACRERSIMIRNLLGISAIAQMLGLFGATFAFAQQPPPGVQVGMLSCNLAPSIGLIVAESQRMSCRFAPNGGYPPQIYDGVMNTVGLELGVTAGGAMAWGVFAPTGGAPAGALAGEYVGASGDISVGVGIGANVLFGGSNRTIALQPLSIEGEAGLNVSLGVSGLRLAFVR